MWRLVSVYLKAATTSATVNRLLCPAPRTPFLASPVGRGRLLKVGAEAAPLQGGRNRPAQPRPRPRGLCRKACPLLRCQPRWGLSGPEWATPWEGIPSPQAVVQPAGLNLSPS